MRPLLLLLLLWLAGCAASPATSTGTDPAQRPTGFYTSVGGLISR